MCVCVCVCMCVCVVMDCHVVVSTGVLLLVIYGLDNT